MVGRWEELRERSLVHVVAAPGYGKTAAVRRWLGDAPAVWSSGAPPAPPGPPPEHQPGWLVVDDLPARDGQAVAAIQEWLVEVPPAWRVVTISRWPLAVLLRRGGAPAAGAGPADLALPAERVAEVLRQQGAPADLELAAELYDLTAGWPALVRRAAQQLAGGQAPQDQLGEALAGPGTPLSRYLVETVLPQQPVAARRLLAELADLGHACAELVGPRRAGTLRQLAAAGLVVPAGPPPAAYQADPAPPGPWYRPVPALAAAVRAGEPLPAATRRRHWLAAAGWYRRQQLPGPAARALLAGGDSAGCARLLREHGSGIVAAGGATLVTELVARLPAPERDRSLRLLAAEALALVGDNDAALAELAGFADDRLADPAVARRLGLVHYQRADKDAALAALRGGPEAALRGGPEAALRGGQEAAERTCDEALLLAQLATVYWSLGSVDDCRRQAELALRAAGAAGDHRAQASAHVAAALHAALVGDRAANAAHYDRALACAERGRDVVQVARIRANQISLLLEEARYPEALAAAGPAVVAAETAGHAAMLALALVNEAAALVRLGRFARAERDYRRAIALHQRAGSAKVAYPLVGLGELHAYRGELNLARAAYEEALRLADEDGFQQCLIPALAGLARVLAGTDAAAAHALARRALAHATGPLRTHALLVEGWALAGLDDRAGAIEAAAAAAASARQHRDRASLAEALELRAASSDDAHSARAALREAAQTWRATGSQLDSDRVARWLGTLPGASEAERLAGRVAQTRLDRTGVPPFAPVAAGRASSAAPQVEVRTLGRFEVLVGGAPVPPAGWQSRKARDLLRMLVARRGRMVAREELSAQLWPDMPEPARVAHRFSVALSTLRSVLDPRRRQPADHYVRAGSGGVALELAHVRVDLEAFLADAELGLRLHATGQHADAYPLLSAARQGYPGEFCEDDPYDDWLAPPRDEARAVHLRVLRALAEISGQTGQVDEAVGHLLQILGQDPYDEPSHRQLVALLTAAGRHGEARRASARYHAAMRELGLTAESLATRADRS